MPVTMDSATWARQAGVAMSALSASFETNPHSTSTAGRVQEAEHCETRLLDSTIRHGDVAEHRVKDGGGENRARDIHGIGRFLAEVPEGESRRRLWPERPAALREYISNPRASEFDVAALK